MSNQQQGIGAGGVLLAFIAGAAVGAAAALLLAPASGEETRAVVGRRTREGRDRVLQALREGRGLINQQRDSVLTAFERARTQAQAGVRGPEQDA